MIKSKIPTRGFAILLVLMFLFLLSTLGIAFLMVRVTQWEIVETWYDDVRAREIAETGIYETINRFYLTFPVLVPVRKIIG
jgi:Tfp pilus assembly protein PilX